MNEHELSICIPSKRSYADSKDSISSAIGFCDSSNSGLYISDSSGDKNKKELWGSLNLKNFNYYESKYETSTENWHNAAKNANGMFIGMLSDDDLLVNIKEPEIHYSLLPNNITGIKPNIQLWTEKNGFYSINSFSLTHKTAIERVKSYVTSANGNNTTLYSFFKGSLLKDLQSASLYHPLKAGCSDWSIVLALVSSGQVLYDPSKLYIYKNTNWIGSTSNIENEQKNLYKKVGISDRAFYFSRVFRAIDGLTYIIRKDTPINRGEAIEAGKFIFELNLNIFKQEFLKSKKYFEEDEVKEIDKIKLDDTSENKLDILISLLDKFDKKIACDFINFYQKVTGNNWGIIK